jgi:K+-sensing histidine kinase KdpD
VGYRLNTFLGILSCAAAAGCLITFFRGSSFRPFLPILFLTVIVLVALRFGTLAGILGTMVAGLLFAVFLFEPTRSLEVSNSAERSNLIWMVVGGVAASELLGNPSRSRPQRRT